MLLAAELICKNRVFATIAVMESLTLELTLSQQRWSKVTVQLCAMSADEKHGNYNQGIRMLLMRCDPAETLVDQYTQRPFQYDASPSQSQQAPGMYVSTTLHFQIASYHFLHLTAGSIFRKPHDSCCNFRLF